MSEIINFDYNNNQYQILKNEKDPSTWGCIVEIVFNNEYILENFINHNSTFIDIGANCGVVTIILAKQNPLSTIFAFEPDIDVFNILIENIKLNNLNNVKLFNKAVMKEGIEFINLYKHPKWSGGNTTCSSTNIINNFFKIKINEQRVECISLDKIILDNDIKKIELLKIDCEGAEYEILYNSNYLKYNNILNENSSNLINYCRPYIKNILKISELTI